MLRREDGLIDWSLDAHDIERRVRGFQPWPNAYTSYNGRRLVIWRAAPLKLEAARDACASTVSAGEIIKAHADSLVVACGGATALGLLELQLEGKQRMRARDFINGTHLRAGERFS